MNILFLKKSHLNLVLLLSLALVGCSQLPISQIPSDNYNERIRFLVIHFTTIDYQDSVRALTKGGVSAHYLIPENNDPSYTESKLKTFQLVDESKRAWHAGASSWGSVRDVNSHSIGIELANPGHELGYPAFPEAQMTALEGMLLAIKARWSIAPERIVGHACIAPGRKIDPGEKFPWEQFSRQGLGIWLPREDSHAQGAPDADLFRQAARRFGYGVPEGQGWDTPLLAVWRSFAMRFLPGDPFDDAALRPHARGVLHLQKLAKRWPVVDLVSCTD